MTHVAETVILRVGAGVTQQKALVVFLQENCWWFSWPGVPHGHWGHGPSLLANIFEVSVLGTNTGK